MTVRVASYATPFLKSLYTATLQRAGKLSVSKLSDEEKRKEAAASLLKEMEATAARMRALIVAMPAHDLLGYIYAQHMMKAMAVQSTAEENDEADGQDDLIN